MKSKKFLLVMVTSIGLITTTMAQSVPSYVSTSGLVGWWGFNGNANDSSGKGNHGTVTGASLTTDRFGKSNSAYSFNGTSNKIVIGNSSSLQFSSEVTVSAWILAPTNISLSKNIISKYNGIGSNATGWSLETRDIQGALFTGVGQAVLASSGSIYINQWIHIVGTYSNKTWEIYINGSLSNQKSYSSTYNLSNSLNMIIGIQNDNLNTDTYWLGKLDDIGIWNRALSKTEVSNLYTPGCKMTNAKITPGGATTFCQGNDVVLSSSLTGSSYKYSWFMNGTAISGATSYNYVANQQGNYTVMIDSSNCSSTSNGISVIVNSLPSATITPNGATTFCKGSNVILNANTGSGLSYQWKNNGNDISGATASNYTVTSSGNYMVEVKTAAGCFKTAASVSVIVNYTPTASISAGGATTFCQGESVLLNAVTDSGTTYQWKLNGSNISGETNATYLAYSTGNYSVTVGNAYPCSATSTNITVIVNKLPNVSINSIPYAINIKDNPLTIVGNPSGGTFSGSGMSSNKFYPSSASLGAKKIFYKYTDGNGCTNTAIASTVVYDTTICSISVTDTLIIKVKLSGISPPNNTNTVKIYPNPTKSNITIDCGNYTSMNGYSIKINNSIGQTVYNQQVTQKLVNIDLSGWSGKGVYYVYIIDKQSYVIETKKIILE